MKQLTEDQIRCLKELVEHAQKEDQFVRERQIRLWRKLKLYWDGFQRIWFSEVAHDWRVADDAIGTDEYSAYYDKPVNVFRAYLESIIAALSISIPGIKCIPDDADNPLDIQTAKAGDKIAELIYKHNDVSLLWLHALYIYITEGLVAAYTYTKSSTDYGTYSVNKYEVTEESIQVEKCPACASRIVDGYCPKCLEEVANPLLETELIQGEKLTGTSEEAKSRQCIEVFGGLFVKVPVYAKKQSECPYLIYSYETHYSNVLEKYPKLRDKVPTGNSSKNGKDYYEREGRTSTQYLGEDPDNTTTISNAWIRPCLYNILDEKEADDIRELFPKGVKVVLVNNDHFAEAQEEALDDHWTLTENPLSDFLHHEPPGLLLTSTQEITNDMIALVLQTIEHGIPQTFADPGVVDFDLYRKTEITPGLVFPATPKGGRSLGEAFYEVKVANLSREVQPFFEKVHELGQLVSGALPSLFGGPAPNSSKTAAQYAMSRAQALQRQQTPWKMLTLWWKNIFSKTIPAYIKTMVVDERVVEEDPMGGFINTIIKKAEVSGRIGRIELEAAEQIPATHSQKRDTLMELINQGNPIVLEALGQPDNLPVISQLIGLSDLVLPNEIDIEKQYEEIQFLLQSEPIAEGIPSIDIEPEVDNHLIESEICKRWVKSAAGRQAKIDNPAGYQNVLLHLKRHVQIIQVQQIMSQASQMGTGNSPAKREGTQNGSTNQYNDPHTTDIQ